MKNARYDHGYGTAWKDVYVEKRERYRSSVTDFHEHDFYEINLILSGNVRVLAANQAVTGEGCKIVLTPPGASHFISCRPDVLYSSLYLVFSESFIASFDVQTAHLLSVFRENGSILSLTREQAAFLAKIIEEIGREQKEIKKRLLVFYLLSCLEDFPAPYADAGDHIPAYIHEALSYIDGHFSQRLSAQEIARQLHIGRTTLMTGFKKYTGKTLHEYLLARRLSHAIRLLSSGATEYEAALSSGFHDASGLIHCFKRILHTTPRQYMLRSAKKEERVL